MNNVAIAFSTRDRVELTRQSIEPLLQPDKFDLFWMDGSDTAQGQNLAEHGIRSTAVSFETHANIRGGADAAIVYGLTTLLNHPNDYEYVGLCENDVLLDPDWLDPTMALFDNPDGLSVGAVSARSYEDRVLIQRDGYAVMHNVGAGHIILTREAAQIVLDNYRTGWWPENRAVFSQLSGLDIGKWGAFSFNEQMITADWSYDTILAAHGLATVALTPSKATMIGQELTLEQQGLKYATGNRYSAFLEARDAEAFPRFRANLIDIREGKIQLPPVDHQLCTRNGSIIFSHHAHKHAGIFTGKWTTRWLQGFGPFGYVAKSDASFSIPLFGPCAFHVMSGRVSVTDEAAGFNTDVDLTDTPDIVTIAVPRDMQNGVVRLELGEGACLAGIETQHPQPRMTTESFDYSRLPEVG